MTTKLVSANLGLRLTLEVDGKQSDIQFSFVCPSVPCNQPYMIPVIVQDFLSDQLGIDIWKEEEIEIAKPKKIKAPKKISQAEFNRKIKELVP